MKTASEKREAHKTKRTGFASEFLFKPGFHF